MTRINVTPLDRALYVIKKAEYKDSKQYLVELRQLQDIVDSPLWRIMNE